MTDATTVRMLDAYRDLAGAPMFLAGMFQTPPRNFHTTEKVELDIERDDPHVALPVRDVSVGPRHNEATKFTNKAWTPPVFNESTTITAYDLLDRDPGDTPYDSPEYIAKARVRAIRAFPKLEAKIRRAIELMASQVLQTGEISIADSSGVLHEEDFMAKATHFPTAAVAWGGVGAAPLTDLAALGTVVRRDGKRRPLRLVFGEVAFDRFIADDEVKSRLDNRNMMIGEIAPQVRGEGATFQGFVWVGHYRFEMWTYDGFYLDPITGAPTPFVDPNKVIMLSEGGRLDLSFGAIPRLKPPDGAAMALVPTRMSDGNIGLDLNVNAWFSPDGTHLHVSAGTRPLTIPTAIDTYGCLTAVFEDS